jgi:hypothetical protein
VISWRRALSIGGMVLGVAIMAFAIQTADEVQSPVPHKVQIAHWLETGLWVNPYLLLIGAAILLTGAVLYAMVGRRRRMMPYAMIVVSSFIAMGAIAIFVVWEVMGLAVNLTESAPQ